MRRGESKLPCFCVGSEKLFINIKKFISKYLKRYTVPVGKDVLPPEQRVINKVEIILFILYTLVYVTNSNKSLERKRVHRFVVCYPFLWKLRYWGCFSL